MILYGSFLCVLRRHLNAIEHATPRLMPIGRYAEYLLNICCFHNEGREKGGGGELLNER